MCQDIVGSKERVKTIRKMNAVKDHLSSNDKWTIITSGSYGEGMEMLKSDLDIVKTTELVEVCESINATFNPEKTYFTMETDDAQPGYTLLRLIYSNDPHISRDCKQIGGEHFLSNISVKQQYLNKFFPIIHGPCISDGHLDIAHCLHSKSWIKQATQWITRSNKSWPGYEVKQSIIKHGVLFVPKGVKGSIKENLEWRISFSVGEKLLIYTFSHPQLVCYALLKTLLKDVIDIDLDCKELLCSYFMKTILLWISEECSPTIWKPENLIPNFMGCVRRLVYYVEHSVCPHFFIPENNLFENRFEGNTQETLLKKLKILKQKGWQCILSSVQMVKFNFHFHFYKEPNLKYNKIYKLIIYLIRIYYVKHSVCPHFFITENNLFENRIKGLTKELLFKKLQTLTHEKWQHLLDPFFQSNVFIHKEESLSYINTLKLILSKNRYLSDNILTSFPSSLEEELKKILALKISKIRYLYIHYVSKICWHIVQLQPFGLIYDNKSSYSQYKTYICNFLLNIRHDVVSGWLLLASFFYKIKQYKVALNILKYSLLKCSQEKLYAQMDLSHIHYEIFRSQLFRQMSITKAIKTLVVHEMTFIQKSSLVPDEFTIGDDTGIYLIPAVVYAHSLCFLYHYHLNDKEHREKCLRNLHSIFKEGYLISNDVALKASSYTVLGILLQLSGDIKSARKAFRKSFKLHPNTDLNYAYMRSLLSCLD